MKNPKIAQINLKQELKKRNKNIQSSPRRLSKNLKNSPNNKNSKNQQQQTISKEFLKKGSGGLFKSRSKSTSKHIHSHSPQKPFKKPLQQIKRQLFPQHRHLNQIQTSKKILKKIGDQAQRKSRQIQNNKIKQINKKIIQKKRSQFQQLKKNAGNSTQLEVFLPEDKYMKIYKEHQQKLKHLNQQQIYEESQQQQYVPIRLFSSKTHYQQIISENDSIYSFGQKNQTPSQQQIETICQIYSLCGKFQEKDKLSSDQFEQLIAQFQRRYAIKKTNKNLGDSQCSLQMQQTDFYDLIQQFKQNFRIIFFRSHKNNIFDCLYHLTQSNRLKKVCNKFQLIKLVLKL